ncbi:hypothetical protein [Niallia sp. FSL K6-0077]|uniref:hypothetical protein n=1 Tax=Niallia sp. FSL K6-0077 TaxID=2954743 RepID=UPI0030F62A71
MLLEVKYFNLSEDIFENETVADLYVVKDKQGVEDTYTFSLSVYTWSYTIYSEKDFEGYYLKQSLPFSNHGRKDKLVELMKKIINEWDE